MSCVRKPTRPAIIRVPRRSPTQQVSAKRIDPAPLILRSALTPQPPAKSPEPPRKRVTFASPEVQSCSPPTDLSEASGPSVALPRRVLVSSYALDTESILRNILTEKGLNEGDIDNYSLQTADSPPHCQHAETPTSPHDCKTVTGAKRIPVCFRADRTTRHPAYPPFKSHRLWRLKPGLYELVGSVELRREVLLRVGKTVVRTVLPKGVPEPPQTNSKTYLEVGTPKDGQLHRVSVKWISV